MFCGVIWLSFNVHPNFDLMLVSTTRQHDTNPMPYQCWHILAGADQHPFNTGQCFFASWVWHLYNHWYGNASYIRSNAGSMLEQHRRQWPNIGPVYSQVKKASRIFKHPKTCGKQSGSTRIAKHLKITENGRQSAILNFIHYPTPHILVYILAVKLKMINQDRMIFGDFSVNFDPISLKFCRGYFLLKS